MPTESVELTALNRIEDGATTTNFGSENPSTCGLDGTGDINRLIMRETLSNKYLGSTVTAATLTLESQGFSATSTFRARRLTPNNFGENSSTWIKRTSGADWASPGADFTTTDQDSASFSTGNDGDTLDFAAMANLVQDAIDSRSLNLRLIVMSDDEGTLNVINVYTDDEASASKRPAISITATLETGLPTVAITSPTDAEHILNDSSIAITGTASDAISGVELVETRINGGSFSPAIGTTSWTATETAVQGENTIEARATDFAGNVSTLDSVDFFFGFTQTLSADVLQSVTIGPEAGGANMGRIRGLSATITVAAILFQDKMEADIPVTVTLGAALTRIRQLSATITTAIDPAPADLLLLKPLSATIITGIDPTPAGLNAGQALGAAIQVSIEPTPAQVTAIKPLSATVLTGIDPVDLSSDPPNLKVLKSFSADIGVAAHILADSTKVGGLSDLHGARYHIEIHDPAGVLLHVSPDWSMGRIRQTIDTPSILNLRVPITDDYTTHATFPNELWVRDSQDIAVGRFVIVSVGAERNGTAFYNLRAEAYAAQLTRERITDLPLPAGTTVFGAIQAAFTGHQVSSTPLLFLTITAANRNQAWTGKVENMAWPTFMDRVVSTWGGRWYVKENRRELVWEDNPTAAPEVHLRFDNQLTGILRDSDFSGIVTRVYAFGAGEGDARIKLSQAAGQSTDFLDSAEVANFGIQVGFLEDRTITDPEVLLDRATEELARVDTGLIRYSASAADLEKASDSSTPFSDRVNARDLVHVRDDLTNVDADLIVVAKLFNLDNPVETRLEFANRVPTLATEITRFGTTIREGDTLTDTGQTILNPLNDPDSRVFLSDWQCPTDITKMDGAKICDGTIPVTALEDPALPGAGSDIDDLDDVDDGTEFGRVRQTHLDAGRPSIEPDTQVNRLWQTAELADGLILTDKLANQAVTTDKIKDKAIRDQHVGQSTLSGDRLAQLSVGGSRLKDNSISLAKMQNDSVGTAELIDAGTTEVKLADASVSERTLVSTEPIISTSAIKTGAITTALIASGNVFRFHMANGAVATPVIQDNAVTEEKLSDALVARIEALENAVQIGLGLDKAIVWGDNIITNGDFTQGGDGLDDWFTSDPSGRRILIDVTGGQGVAIGVGTAVVSGGAVRITGTGVLTAPGFPSPNAFAAVAQDITFALDREGPDFGIGASGGRLMLLSFEIVNYDSGHLDGGAASAHDLGVGFSIGGDSVTPGALSGNLSGFGGYNTAGRYSEIVTVQTGQGAGNLLFNNLDNAIVVINEKGNSRYFLSFAVKTGDTALVTNISLRPLIPGAFPLPGDAGVSTSIR